VTMSCPVPSSRAHTLDICLPYPWSFQGPRRLRL
jgi:hypothetical protein